MAETMAKIESVTQLTDKQRQALTVLVEGGTFEEAAKAADCNVRTIYRWRENPAFAAALLSADPHSLETIFTDVLRVGGKSIMLLEKIIDGQGKEFPLNAKLRASAIVLQHLGGIYQLVGLEQQIAEVKAQLEALQAVKLSSNGNGHR